MDNEIEQLGSSEVVKNKISESNENKELEIKAEGEKIDSRETVQRAIDLKHSIVIKEGNGKELNGEVVYKDKNNSIVQTSKMTGYRVDTSAIGNFSVGDRIQVLAEDGVQRSIKQTEFRKGYENEIGMSVDMDTDASIGI